MKKRFATILMLSCAALSAQPSPYTNAKYAPVTMTATGQTSAAVALSKSGVGDSFATGTVTLTGAALTTATFGVLGSADGGVNYFSISVCPVLTPNVCAATATATANGMYLVPSLAGVDHIKFVTAGTFTATSISLVLSAAPNGVVAQNTGGSSAAAISYVGSTAAFNASAVTTNTVNYSCTVGNLVHVAATYSVASLTPGISSVPSATWRAEYAVMPSNPTTSQSVQVWDETCPATGSQAVTVTSTTNAACNIAITEMHGTDATKFDHVAFATAAAPPISVTSSASLANSAAIVDIALGAGTAVTGFPAGYLATYSANSIFYGFQNPAIPSGSAAFSGTIGATAWLASISIFHL